MKNSKCDSLPQQKQNEVAIAAASTEAKGEADVSFKGSEQRFHYSKQQKVQVYKL